MVKIPRLKDGSVCWHSLYYGLMPNILTDNAPPFGDYNYAYYIVHPHCYLRDCYLKLKWFIQRGHRGYADCDTWSLDYYLSGWLPAALQRLVNNKIGHPSGMTQRGWETRLAKMRDGFIAAKAVGDMKFKTKAESQALQRKMNIGLRLFVKHYLSLWD